MSKIDEIAEVIKGLARERIEGVGLRRIDVEFDRDSDGDEIVKILIVVDNPQLLNRETLVGFHRLVFDRIWGNTEAFPMISFRSSDDDRVVTSEAA